MEKEKKYFYGNEVSEYGVENGRVDYRTLAKAFDAVMNNEIIQNTSEIGYWDMVNGDYTYHEDVNGNIYSPSEADEKLDELREELEEIEDNEPDEDDFNMEDSTEYDKAYEEWEKKCEEKQNEIDRLEEEHEDEVFQYFIISDNGADILQRETNEIVWYNEALDMYVWGVTHWGTSWDYVLTQIEI